MPNIGFGEMVLILLAALMVFGPKKLPGMGRSVGQALREFRQATSDVKRQLKEEIDEEQAPAEAKTKKKATTKAPARAKAKKAQTTKTTAKAKTKTA